VKSTRRPRALEIGMAAGKRQDRTTEIIYGIEWTAEIAEWQNGRLTLPS
jgi:hypothetical protein